MSGKFIDFITNSAERFILLLILALTLVAVFLELVSVYERQNVALADLLLLFIYAEVISMVAVFLKSREVPVIYPIFIAITALARLIILQGKEMDPTNIFYEAVSILVLALSVVILKSGVNAGLFKKFARQVQGVSNQDTDQDRQQNREQDKKQDKD